jgi:hypothetical protein
MTIAARSSLVFFCVVFLVNSLLYGLSLDYDTVRVSDFGLVVNTRKNATKIVKMAIKKAREYNSPLLIFEEGRYDFWPQYSEEREYFESNTTDNNPKRLAILIDGFEEFTLDGNGAEFVFHDRMQPVTVDNSSNVIIKNFSVDWDIPLTAQAEVIDIDDNSITLKINKYESPYVIEDGKLIFVGEGWKSAITGVMEIEKETRLIAPYTGDPGCCGRGWDKASAEEIEPGLVRVIKSFGLQRPDIGNYLILRHSHRDHAGMFLFHSKDVSIENVQIYHTAGLGILSQFTENISMDRVKMIPNSRKSRYLSGHDDGFHFSNCKGLISVTNCEFAALMDDPINIHGTSVRIIKKISDNKLQCSFMHHQSVGLQWARPGEKIGFISSGTMETLKYGVVIEFKKLSKTDFEIKFEEPIPNEIQVSDALENITWTPSATISGNKFMSCRARGILVSTPGKVVIENNYFESSGSAILMAGDANNWYETGAVHDVLIRKNVFADPCLTSLYQFSEAIISIFPEIPNLEKSTPKYHRNITIEENEFHPFDYPILYAKSVDGLIFNNNVIERSKRFKPFHPRKYSFTIEFCENVKISGNTYKGDVLGRNILLDGTNKKEIELGKGQSLRFEKPDN